MTAIPSTGTLFLLAIGLLLAGALLLKKGRWPARRGVGQYCPRCDYLLTGLETPRCPECGADLSIVKPKRGGCHRRPLITSLGVLLVLLGMGTLIAADFSRRSSITEYLPTWVLVRNLRIAQSAESAWQELDRRNNAGKLSLHDDQAIGDVALASMESINSSPLGIAMGSMGNAVSLQSRLIGFLGQAIADNKATPAQRDRFFELMCIYEFKTRPKVLLGTRVTAQLGPRYTGLMPFWPGDPPHFWQQDIAGPLLVDGEEVLPGDTSGGDGLTGGLRTSTSYRTKSPGHHLLTQTFEQRVGLGAYDSDQENPPFIWHKSTTFTLPFEVIADKSADPMLLIDDEATGAAVRKAISLGVSARSRGTGADIHISITPRPADVAFEVIVREGDKERSIGDFALPASSRTTWVFSDEALAGPTVDIILRPSDTAARQTVDLHGYWNGPIEFKNIPVIDPKRGARPSTYPSSPSPLPALPPSSSPHP